MKRDFAFSGLEAGIILIAFIVVAAVFSYAILGSGFYAAEKTEEVTQQGSQQASAVMYAEGSMYGSLYPSDDPQYPDQLKMVTFSMSIPPTGLAQDLSECIIIYTQYDKEGHIVFNPRTYTFGGTNAHDLYYGVENGDKKIMHPGETRVFTLDDLEGPEPGGYFTIETKPRNGVGAFIKKYLPGAYAGGVLL